MYLKPFSLYLLNINKEAKRREKNINILRLHDYIHITINNFIFSIRINFDRIVIMHVVTFLLNMVLKKKL